MTRGVGWERATRQKTIGELLLLCEAPCGKLRWDRAPRTPAREVRVKHDNREKGAALGNSAVETLASDLLREMRAEE